MSIVHFLSVLDLDGINQLYSTSSFLLFSFLFFPTFSC